MAPRFFHSPIPHLWPDPHFPLYSLYIKNQSENKGELRPNKATRLEQTKKQ